MTEVTKWTFGEAPLTETIALAAALHDLAGNALALEHPTPEISRFTADVVTLGKRLEALLPPDPRPRVGDDPAADRRVYVDHSHDIGDYNPCFPQYRVDVCGRPR